MRAVSLDPHNGEYFKSIIFKNGILSCNPDGTKIYFNNRLLSQHIVKPKHSKRGFRVVQVAGKKMYVHRIVALIYVSNPNKYQYCLHIDTNTLNNYYRNLTWGSMKDIPKHMRGEQRTFGASKNNRNKSKISKEEVKNVLERLENGESMKSIAEDYETSSTSIYRIKKRYL